MGGIMMPFLNDLIVPKKKTEHEELLDYLESMRSGAPEKPGFLDPVASEMAFKPVSAGPPVPAKSPSRIEFEELLSKRPEMPTDQPWWKALVGGAMGGMQGFLNTSPAREVHQDPRVLDQALQRLRLGDFPEEEKNYLDKLELAKTKVGLEEGDVKRGQKERELATEEEYSRARAKYLTETKPEIAQTAANARMESTKMRYPPTEFGKLPQEVQSYLNTGKSDDQLWRPDDMVASRFLDEAFGAVNKQKQLTSQEGRTAHEVQGRITTTGMRTESAEDIQEKNRKSREQIAREDRQSQENIARMPARSQPEKGAKAANPADIEAEYMKNMRQAEQDYKRELNILNGKYKIGQGDYGSVASPDKLPKDARAEYERRKSGLDAALEDRKEQVEELKRMRTQGVTGQPAPGGPAPVKTAPPPPKKIEFTGTYTRSYLEQMARSPQEWSKAAKKLLIPENSTIEQMANALKAKNLPIDLSK